MRSAPETIEVIVTAEHRVFYKRVCKMPKAVFDKYEAMCDAENFDARAIDREFEDWVDTTDVYDSNDLEDVTIEAVNPAQTIGMGT